MPDRAVKYIEVTADASKAISELRKLRDQAAASHKQLGVMNKSLDSITNSIRSFAASFGFLAGGTLVYGIVDLADAYANLNAQLKSTLQTTEAAEAQFNTLLGIANSTGTAITSLTAAFTKMKVAVPDVPIEQINFSLETLNTVLVKTGSGVQQTNAVLLQMSQALGAGALQGDEFRSVAENAPVVLKAWQEALDLTGKSFKEISADADFTAESFFRLQEQIRANVETMIGTDEVVITVGRSFQVLKNNLIELIGAVEDQAPVFQALANAILLLANNLDIAAIALVSLTSAFVAFKAALAIQATVAAFSAAMAAAATATGVFAVAVKGLAALFLGPAGIAVLVGAAVAAILVYWDDLSAIATLSDDYMDLVVAAFNYGMARAREVVAHGINAILQLFADMSTAVSGYLIDLSNTMTTGFEALDLAVPGLVTMKAGLRAMGISAQSASESLRNMQYDTGQLAASSAAAAENLQWQSDVVDFLREDLEDTSVASHAITENLSNLATAAGGGSGESGGGAAGAVSKLNEELKKSIGVLRDAEKGIEDYLDAIEEEIYQLSLSDDQRELRNVELELERTALDLAAKGTEALAAGQLQLAEAYRQAAGLYEKTIPTAQELTRQKQAAEDWKNAWEGAVGGVTDTLEKGFEDLFTGSLDSAKSFAEDLFSAIKSGVAKILVYLAKQAFTVNVTANITSSGGVGNVVGAVSGTGGATGTGIGGLGSLLSGTGIGESISGALRSGLEFIGVDVSNALGGAVESGLSNLASASNLALTAGSLLGGILGGSLFEGGYSGVGASAGSTLGTLIAGASSFGPVGTVAAGLLGGVGGGFLGSLFGGDDRSPYGQFRISGSSISGAGGYGLGASTLNDLTDGIGDLNATLSAFADFLGPEAAAALSGVSITSPELRPADIEAWLTGATREVVQTMIESVPGALGHLYSMLAANYIDTTELATAFQDLSTYMVAFKAAVDTIQPGAFSNMEDVANALNTVAISEIPTLTQAVTDLGTLVNSFKSDAELAAEQQARVNQVFEQLGLAVPATAAELRTLIEGLNLTTAAGSQAAIALAAISSDLGELYQVTAADPAGINAAINSISGFIDSIKPDAVKGSEALASMVALFQSWGLTLPPTESALYDLTQAGAYTNEQLQALADNSIALGDAYAYLGTLTTQVTADLQAAADARIAIYRQDSAANIQAINDQQAAQIAALDAQRTAINDQISTLNSQVGNLTSVINSAQSAIFSLTSVSTTVSGGVDAERQRLLGLVASAVASGTVPTDASAIISGLSQVNAQDFASREDYLAAITENQNALNSLTALAGAERTAAEQQIALLEQQLTALDDQQTAIETQTATLIQAENDNLNALIQAESDFIAAQTSAIQAELITQTQGIAQGTQSTTQWLDYQAALLERVVNALDPGGTTRVTIPTSATATATQTQTKVAAGGGQTVGEGDLTETNAWLKDIYTNVQETNKFIKRWNGEGMPADRQDYLKTISENTTS